MTNSTPKQSKIKNITSGISKFHLEADRACYGMSVTVSGIIGVNSFSKKEIVLKSHSGRIVIEGSALRIKVYENGVCEICGKVENIGFIYGKN